MEQFIRELLLGRDVSGMVLQGSWLSSMLFNMLINDLEILVKSLLVKSADDGTISRMLNNYENRIVTQGNLDCLGSRAHLNITGNAELHVRNMEDKSCIRMGDGKPRF